MQLGVLLVAYFAGLACLVGVLLFGESPALRNTPIGWLHYAITRGWLEAVEWAVYRAWGPRGAAALDACATACCERRNPCLQVVYVAIVAGGYAAGWRSVFALVPGHCAAFATALTAAALASFAAACAADPGQVTSRNSAALLAAYGAGGRACGSCGGGLRRRPARSYHCRTCGVCVARFDHHCSWINGCVGLLNTRHFLVFLICNLALAAFTAGLVVAGVWADLERRGTLSMWLLDRKLGRLVPLTSRPGRLVEIICVYYGQAAALCVFGALSGALLAAFLAQQLWNIAAGVTTYEALKRRAPRRRLRRRLRRRSSNSSSSSGDGGDGGGGGDGDSFMRRARANFYEVLRPRAFLAEAEAAARAAARERSAAARARRRRQAREGASAAESSGSGSGDDEQRAEDEAGGAGPRSGI